MSQPTGAPLGGTATGKRYPLFLTKYPVIIIIYAVLVLPLCTLFFSQDFDGYRTWPHTAHPYLYLIASMVAIGVVVFVCYYFICPADCAPEWAFTAKMVAAIAGPLVLIVCNVLLPLLIENDIPEIYPSYLIGRLCFLVAMTMLFCVGTSSNELDKQYEEGVTQLRIAWAAFALLFASDPVLTHYLYGMSQQAQGFQWQLQNIQGELQRIPNQSQEVQQQVAAIRELLNGIKAQHIPKRIILALVHLNFCGGITLLVLPLWKLNKLREDMSGEKLKSLTQAAGRGDSVEG